MRKILALLLLSVGTPVWAATDGNSLYEQCNRTAQTNNDAAALIACNNYIVGVIDGYRMTKEGYDWLQIPDGVKGQQLQDIVLKYLIDNPEKRHWAAVILVMNAVNTAFPHRPSAAK